MILTISFFEYQFTPKDVVRFSDKVWTIRIHHSVEQYPKRLVFWPARNTSSIIDQIRRIGFIPCGYYRCRKCAYDLTGNESGTCPECGERI